MGFTSWLASGNMTYCNIIIFITTFAAIIASKNSARQNKYSVDIVFIYYYIFIIDFVRNEPSQ